MICRDPVPLVGGSFFCMFLHFSFGFTFHSGCSFPRFMISLKFIGPRYPYLHLVYYFWVCKSSGYMYMLMIHRALYCSFDPRIPGAWQVAMEKLQLCITDIQNWMTCNKLKLNENKTEFIVLGTPQNLKKLPQISLHIGDARIDPTDSVRNL